MIRLRPYKPCDAESIVSWCKDERTFLLWGGDHFGTFPMSGDIMNRKYFHDNGDCAESWVRSEMHLKDENRSEMISIDSAKDLIHSSSDESRE